MHGRLRLGLPKMHGQFRIGLPKMCGRFRMDLPKWYIRFRMIPLYLHSWGILLTFAIMQERQQNNTFEIKWTRECFMPLNSTGLSIF